MSNVTSWNETEIDILVQVWSEVEAKYPALRCSRGAGTLHAKLYAQFSKRCKFTRSSCAVNRAKNRLRIFALFVTKFNEDRRKEGERLWFELSVEEREQRRALLPANIRGLTTSVSQKTFATLLTMERAQRWLESAPADVKQVDDPMDDRSTLSFLSSLPPSPHLALPTEVPKDQDDGEHDLSSMFESTHPSTEQCAKEAEDQLSIGGSESSLCSPLSSFGDDKSSKESNFKRFKPRVQVSPRTHTPEEKETAGQEPQRKLKHRECNALLENMIKLQNKIMRRAESKLRADIEDEVQRSSEMLRSISSNQSDEDVEGNGDAAFVAKVLDMQLQQVQNRFDEFEEWQVREEAANRALLAQRFA
ncbi:uncharacterized protein IUM83_08125 [Phytophthora cinnamomi]|uniref:uncharacterized protein n=1 Tax=Phytophthora cinnamomi TaxID=4785 RepID=UPI00355A9BE5|nr:hypothetical protein IUM83_08125 [Phytophthora cinnamomi]